MSDRRYVIEERKICWPTPDATCLNGGCMYCEDGEWKTMAQLWKYVKSAGVLKHRGMGEEDAVHALKYGFDRQFFGRPPVRTSKEVLAEWAKDVNVLALKKMAEGMPNLHGASKMTVLAWLMRYRRDVLDESFRTSWNASQAVRR